MPKTKYVDFKTVKASVSIVQILDHYGLTERFKRSGDSLSGPCPLHNGDNPTQFRVSISKNCWNCFSECKCGGNIIDFVAHKENCTIRQAALLISEWFGLPTEKPAEKSSLKQPQPQFRDTADKTPTRNQSSDRVSSKKSEPQPTGPNKPLGFQLKDLDRNHPYLAERGLTMETIVDFGVGYCAKGMMAERIAIPIHNSDGKVVAYVGRWPGEPPDKDTPKFKLPPGFRKSQELFNIDRAIKESPDKPLVIVEGFFDCIKLWQHGLM